MAAGHGQVQAEVITVEDSQFIGTGTLDINSMGKRLGISRTLEIQKTRLGDERRVEFLFCFVLCLVMPIKSSYADV